MNHGWIRSRGARSLGLLAGGGVVVFAGMLLLAHPARAAEPVASLASGPALAVPASPLTAPPVTAAPVTAPARTVPVADIQATPLTRGAAGLMAALPVSTLRTAAAAAVRATGPAGVIAAVPSPAATPGSPTSPRTTTPNAPRTAAPAPSLAAVGSPRVTGPTVPAAHQLSLLALATLAVNLPLAPTSPFASPLEPPSSAGSTSGVSGLVAALQISRPEPLPVSDTVVSTVPAPPLSLGRGRPGTRPD